MGQCVYLSNKKNQYIKGLWWKKGYNSFSHVTETLIVWLYVHVYRKTMSQFSAAHPNQPTKQYFEYFTY